MEHDAATELVRRARGGDRAARAMLWTASRGWVAAVVLAHGARRHEVEDLLQEVAVRLLAKLESLKEPAAFRPWLRTLAINVTRSAVRERSGGVDGSLEVELDVEDLADRRSSEHTAARGELDEVMGRVHALPEQYREPLLLKAVEGMSQRAIAELLGLSEEAVETRLARARRMLRQGMASPSEGGPPGGDHAVRSRGHSS